MTPVEFASSAHKLGALISCSKISCVLLSIISAACDKTSFLIEIELLGAWQIETIVSIRWLWRLTSAKLNSRWRVAFSIIWWLTWNWISAQVRIIWTLFWGSFKRIRSVNADHIWGHSRIAMAPFLEARGLLCRLAEKVSKNLIGIYGLFWSSRDVQIGWLILENYWKKIQKLNIIHFLHP